MLIPAPVALVLNEPNLAPNFIVPGLTVVCLGLVLRKRFKPTEPALGNLMVVVAAGWILAALFSAVPYVLSTRGMTEPMSFGDAYFESMAGYTTTGLSTIGERVEFMPRTVLFWRSLTQWVGGVGIVVMFLTALVGWGKAARELYVAEARVERIEPSVRETARSIWKIYAVLTLGGILALYFIGGMPFFDSTNHALTGISTGGFSVKNESFGFAGYGRGATLIAIFIMLAGATSFAVHRRVFGGEWRTLFGNVEVRLMLALFLFGTIFLVFTQGLRDGAFQSASALTGTGFSTTSLVDWGALQKGILSFLMIVGGGFGSTAGGIKLIRTVIIFRALYWMVKRSFLPDRAVVPLKIAGRVYSDREIMETAIYAFIYFIVLVLGAAALAMLGNPGIDSVFESASAQGNVGLSVMPVATMPVAGKAVLTLQMLIGRLEIIPVIALLGYLISKVPRSRARPF